jgi:hypothetical protein
MILEAVDLELNSNEYNQHLFVFVFFAANTVIEAGAILLLVDYKHLITTDLERDSWTTLYVLLAVFYFISNMMFINILKRVWSLKSHAAYLCPILNQEISLIVYI